MTARTLPADAAGPSAGAQPPVHGIGHTRLRNTLERTGTTSDAAPGSSAGSPASGAAAVPPSNTFRRQRRSADAGTPERRLAVSKGGAPAAAPGTAKAGNARLARAVLHSPARSRPERSVHRRALRGHGGSVCAGLRCREQESGHVDNSGRIHDNHGHAHCSGGRPGTPPVLAWRPAMPITSLYLTDFGPFEEIAFEFDPQVNVFTGPNNSGKSSALLMLGELLVYPFLAPHKLYRSDRPEWKLCYSVGTRTESVGGHLPCELESIMEVYGVVGYTSFVPAQRSATDFRASGPSAGQDVEARAEKLANMFAQARPEELKRLGFEALRNAAREKVAAQHAELKRRGDLALAHSPSRVDDTGIVQKIIDIDYAAYRQDRPEIRNVIDKIIAVVSEITEGYPMKFGGVGEDERGLFLRIVTPSGTLPLDVLSQGTQSLIHSVAHLMIGYGEYYEYSADLEQKPGVLLIDEIDAHLHPSWQRRIIPTLIRHLPNLQIFCSTHSPLMLAGLRPGQVQLLRLGKDGKVSVTKNEPDIVGWSADEILRNFLDVPAPTDIGTAVHVARLEELRRKKTLTRAESGELEALRRTVGSELLRGPMSTQVEQFADELRRARDNRPAG